MTQSNPKPPRKSKLDEVRPFVSARTAHSVRQFMSVSPLTIGRDQPLARAHEVMRSHRIRHLPVLDGGKLLGVISQRDLYLVESLKGVEPSTVTVEEAMSQDVYCVAPDTDLREVIAEMIEHKYGCAVVMDSGHVAGVFTTVDAMLTLERLLSTGVAPARPDSLMPGC